MSENKTKPVRADQEVNAGHYNSEYIRLLFVSHWRELCAYLRSRYQNNCDPEEIAQAAFSKLAEHQNPEDIKNPRAFLFATARNIAIDEFRKTKIRLTYMQEMLPLHESENIDGFSPENVLSKRQRLDLMADSIKRMPQVQRTVLLMHRMENLTYSQIAAKLGLSETTTRRHLAKAIERLHKDLKHADGGHLDVD